MNVGDLVKYRNSPRIPKPLLGIIVVEEQHSIDSQFFRVLLEDGRVMLISDHYLEMIDKK